MKKLVKTILLMSTVLSLLNGCFIAGQIHDKIYEDCAIHPDSIQRLPQQERQRLAGKCGWKEQPAQHQSLLNMELLCRADITAPPAQGKRSGTIETTLPNGLKLHYRIINGTVPELKVLYPSGKTETHTRFADGRAQGWSEGYYPSGKLRTRFFYQNGKARQYEIYSEDGKVAEKGKVSCR
ncbi:toxin-antitoxin system YwqK family antitoxin [Neisseria musculi]|uniref:Lipoprotein n=1 Tax=Neisseria musculi TaxID=1815583 RepID=A0A7H1MBN2_9NEIS|nr:hypothetical protein [Neisseria musculi]QNT59047.1 putative lipoprotein [Neisseria musculi]